MERLILAPENYPTIALIMSQKPIETYDFNKSNEPYFHTPDHLIGPKLALLNLQDGELLVELGCGDARVLIEACRIHPNIQCRGYENRPEIVAEAKRLIKEAGLEDRITVSEEDMFDVDLSEANAVIMYFTRFILGALSLKLERELKPGSRIVTHDFDLPAWREVNVVEIDPSSSEPHPIYLYRVPPK